MTGEAQPEEGSALEQWKDCPRGNSDHQGSGDAEPMAEHSPLEEHMAREGDIRDELEVELDKYIRVHIREGDSDEFSATRITAKANALLREMMEEGRILSFSQLQVQKVGTRWRAFVQLSMPVRLTHIPIEIHIG